EKSLTASMSGIPSPSTSTIALPQGLDPKASVAYWVIPPKCPVPSFSQTRNAEPPPPGGLNDVTIGTGKAVPLWYTTREDLSEALRARSGCDRREHVERTVPVAEQYLHACVIGDDQVELAVPIEVGGGHGRGAVQRCGLDAGPEPAVAQAGEDRDPVVVDVPGDHRQIGDTVAGVVAGHDAVPRGGVPDRDRDPLGRHQSPVPISLEVS